MDIQDYTATEPRARARAEHREGFVARSIEQQTAKLPSDLFLWAALGSIAGSLTFQILGDQHKANFLGHWAPTFLSLGIYKGVGKDCFQKPIDLLI